LANRPGWNLAFILCPLFYYSILTGSVKSTKELKPSLRTGFSTQFFDKLLRILIFDRLGKMASLTGLTHGGEIPGCFLNIYPKKDYVEKKPDFVHPGLFNKLATMSRSHNSDLN